jgi:hypothetical protein
MNYKLTLFVRLTVSGNTADFSHKIPYLHGVKYRETHGKNTRVKKQNDCIVVPYFYLFSGS